MPKYKVNEDGFINYIIQTYGYDKDVFLNFILNNLNDIDLYKVLNAYKSRGG